MTMPNKTIYVSEDDLPIFARAQELAGGNLSATISGALREFVARHQPDGTGPLEVKVGRTAYTMQRFQGRLLAEGVQMPSSGHAAVRYSVYQTARGQLAVHRAEPPPLRAYSGDHDPAAVGRWLTDHAARSLDVYPSLDELAPAIPADLLEAVKLALSGQSHVQLDI